MQYLSCICDDRGPRRSDVYFNMPIYMHIYIYLGEQGIVRVQISAQIEKRCSKCGLYHDLVAFRRSQRRRIDVCRTCDLIPCAVCILYIRCRFGSNHKWNVWRAVTAFTTSDFGPPESELVRYGIVRTVLCAGSTRARSRCRGGFDDHRDARDP